MDFLNAVRVGFLTDFLEIRAVSRKGTPVKQKSDQFLLESSDRDT